MKAPSSDFLRCSFFEKSYIFQKIIYWLLQYLSLFCVFVFVAISWISVVYLFQNMSVQIFYRLFHILFSLFHLFQKMSANLAAAISVVFSVIAVLACMIMLPMTYNKIYKIRSNLRTGMDNFMVGTFSERWEGWRRSTPLDSSEYGLGGGEGGRGSSGQA